MTIQINLLKIQPICFSGHGNSTHNQNKTDFQENNQNLSKQINSSLQLNQGLTSESNNSHEELTGQHSGLGSGSESTGHNQDLGMKSGHEQGLESPLAGSGSGSGPDKKNEDQGSVMVTPLTGPDGGLGSGSGSGFGPVEGSGLEHEKISEKVLPVDNFMYWLLQG